MINYIVNYSQWNSYRGCYEGGKNVTIDAGTGNDTIFNSGDNVLFVYSGGNDYIRGFDATSTLKIASGTMNSVINSNGEDLFLTIGKSIITLYGAARIYKNINIIDTEGKAVNFTIKPDFNFTEGDDYESNFLPNVTLNALGGNDTIWSRGGSKVLISGGKGNDYIYNDFDTTVDLGMLKLEELTVEMIISPDNNTLLGGNGNDYIYNYLGSNISINGGEGDDTIESKSPFSWFMLSKIGRFFNKNVTADGGAGNDSIFGFDGKIFGGNGDDCVYISNKAYADGYARFVTIDGETGNDFICAEKGAESIPINGGDGNDTISCSYAKDVTILGDKGNDLISIGSGKNNLFQYSLGDNNDTIYGFNGDDSIQLLTDSKIAANMNGNDAIFKVDDTAEAITLKDVLSGGSAQIKFLSKNGDALTTYNFNKNTGVITDESDSITLTSPFDGTFDASNYTNVDASTADNKITLTSGKTNSVTLSGGTNDDSIQNFTANSSLFGGAGNDTITNKTSYSETVTRQVTETVRVQEPTGYYENVPVTIKASARLPAIDKEIKEIKASIQDHLDKADKYEEWARDGNAEWWLKQRDDETLAADNLQGILKDYQADYDAMLSRMLADGDYTLETGETEKKFHQTGTKWVDKIETKNVTETLTHQTDNVSTTILGGAGDDYIVNEAVNCIYEYTSGDGNDTIDGFNEASKLYISGGDYTATASGNDVVLKVGNGSITLMEAKGKVLNINDEKTFKRAWTLNDKTAIYGNEIETLIAVSGVKSLDGINLSDKTVTLSKAALGTDKVTISEGYTLALADDVAKSSTTKSWSLNKTTATYKQTTTAGYTLADNAITYSEKSVETLATVNGVKSADGLKIKGSVITVSKAALNKKNVTVSNGYTLKLDKNVTKSSTTKAWSLNKTTATYKQTTTTGYTLADNSITYSEKSVEMLATVKGVKSLDGLKIKGNVITVSKAALNKKNVTVSNGYTLKLDKNVAKSSTTKAWSLNKTTATYKQTTKAGYSLADNKITYSEKSAKTLATVKGAKSAKGLSVSGNKITLKNSALSSKVTVGGDYEFDFASNYKKATISGSKDGDTLIVNGKNISINGGAGNDVITANGANITITGGKGNDSLWGNANKDTFIYASGDGNDVIYGFDNTDMLQITGTFSASYNKSKKEVAFNVGTTASAITLKDFSATTFNVNNTDYKIKGSKLIKK